MIKREVLLTIDSCGDDPSDTTPDGAECGAVCAFRLADDVVILLIEHETVI